MMSGGQQPRLLLPHAGDFRRLFYIERGMMMKSNIIQKVGQIGIPIKDLDRAIDFYKQKLGLSLLFNTDRMAFFESNGLSLLLSIPEKEEFAHPSSVLYFQVSDIEDSYERFAAQDVQFIDKPHMVAKMGESETWMVFFKDSEGNTHALMSEVQI